MEIVILFGGGDGGGIVITSHGIRRIPPFNPEVLQELKAVNNLVRIEGGGNELRDVAARLSSSALAHVAKATGVAGASVLFADGDDYVYCGNGRFPIPIPHGGVAQGEFQAA